MTSRQPNRRKPTVTIGVPAYQAERNIVPLLKSLTAQQTSCVKIEHIFVYSDGSTDQTVKLARSVSNPRIKVFSSRKNRGYAHVLQFLMKKSESDVFVTFNDDIIIPDRKTVSYLVKPFLEHPRVTLTGGNTIALRPRSFIGRCVYASYLAFNPIRYTVRNGHTMYTCDGKILALRRDFYKNVRFDGKPTGTVDFFLFFENLRMGGTYRFAKKAIVHFRLPETIRDFRNLQSRSRMVNKLMLEQYGNLCRREAKIPLDLYLHSTARVFLRYPLPSLFFKLVLNNGMFYHRPTQDFKTWELTSSTKNLRSNSS